MNPDLAIGTIAVVGLIISAAGLLGAYVLRRLERREK